MRKTKRAASGSWGLRCTDSRKSWKSRAARWIEAEVEGRKVEGSPPEFCHRGRHEAAMPEGQIRYA